MAQEMLKNYPSKDEMRSPSSFREKQTKRKISLTNNTSSSRRLIDTVLPQKYRTISFLIVYQVSS